MPEPTDKAIADAVRVLVSAGAVFSLPASCGSMSLESAAARLDVRPAWVRARLALFHGWYRLPAGSSGLGQPAGEIRIPSASLVRFEASQAARVARVAAKNASCMGEIGGENLLQKAGPGPRKLTRSQVDDSATSL